MPISKSQEIPKEPFLALLTKQGEYYPLYLVNPTNRVCWRIKQLTGAFASSEDSVIETSKKVSEISWLLPNTFVKIEDIHYTERDFVIWYELDFIFSDRSIIYKRGGVPKYILSDEYPIEPFFDKKGWILELIDRPDNRSIDEITKTMNMGSRYITYNEDGSIKEDISD